MSGSQDNPRMMPCRSHVYYEMHSRFKDVKRVRVPTPGLSSCHSQGCGYRSEKLQIKISTGEGAGHKVQERPGTGFLRPLQWAGRTASDPASSPGTTCLPLTQQGGHTGPSAQGFGRNFAGVGPRCVELTHHWPETPPSVPRFPQFSIWIDPSSPTYPAYFQCYIFPAGSLCPFSVLSRHPWIISIFCCTMRWGKRSNTYPSCKYRTTRQKKKERKNFNIGYQEVKKSGAWGKWRYKWITNFPGLYHGGRGLGEILGQEQEGSWCCRDQMPRVTGPGAQAGGLHRTQPRGCCGSQRRLHRGESGVSWGSQRGNCVEERVGAAEGLLRLNVGFNHHVCAWFGNVSSRFTKRDGICRSRMKTVSNVTTRGRRKPLWFTGTLLKSGKQHCFKTGAEEVTPLPLYRTCNSASGTQSVSKYLCLSEKLK